PFPLPLGPLEKVVPLPGLRTVRCLYDHPSDKSQRVARPSVAARRQSLLPRRVATTARLGRTNVFSGVCARQPGRWLVGPLGPARAARCRPEYTVYDRDDERVIGACARVDGGYGGARGVEYDEPETQRLDGHVERRGREELGVPRCRKGRVAGRGGGAGATSDSSGGDSGLSGEARGGGCYYHYLRQGYAVRGRSLLRLIGGIF
ncbi:hypothetical protein DB88DRAFT_97890, partial [Papiliotrema laurentii]